MSQICQSLTNLRNAFPWNQILTEANICQTLTNPAKTGALLRQRFPRRRDGLLDVLVGVRRAHECRFELRRRQIHAAFQHPPEEPSKPRRIALLGRFPIRHRPVGEEVREHRPHAIHRDAGGRRRLQLRPLRFQPVVHLGMRLPVPQDRPPPPPPPPPRGFSPTAPGLGSPPPPPPPCS